MNTPLKVCLRAAGLTLAATALGLGVNALRGEAGLPLFAERPYEILVPCPDARAEVSGVEPAQVPEGRVVFVDAREPARFAEGHIPGARSLPFDDLFDPPDAELDALKAFEGHFIMVYGDLDGALDSGRLLAVDLAARGVENVRFIVGGAEAWAASGRPFDGKLIPREVKP